ncbi:hypothetical protein [Natronorubrum sp. DTA28]|uniref:hypothetical protein n=1 Tax=Natronorubrum sp. DTA28 TaxID=3447019 RepID=UPI003F879AE3
MLFQEKEIENAAHAGGEDFHALPSRLTHSRRSFAHPSHGIGVAPSLRSGTTPARATAYRCLETL